MRKTLFYTFAIASVLFTSCEKVDDFQQKESSKEQNYDARLSSSLVSLQEAKDIASRKFPIEGIESPCGGIDFPIFTPQQLDGVITIFDTNNSPAIYLMQIQKVFY